MTRFAARLSPGMRILPLLLIFLTVGASQPPFTVPGRTARPLVGFTFISDRAIAAGYDPNTALLDLLRQLHPDLVRIPVYWDSVAVVSGALDFTDVDQLLQTIEQYNARRHQARVILVAGVRNLAWPEIHLPAWVDTSAGLDLGRITASPAYLDYLEASFRRYATSPLLYAWQIENEPLDNTNEVLGAVAIDGSRIAGEVSLLKAIDPLHQVIVTTYNSASISLDLEAIGSLAWFFQLLPGPKPAGHPRPALDLGDILGLDIYVDTPSTPLEEASVVERIGWKAATLTYWADEALADGKELWITEMQGSTWNGDPGFSQEDLLESAQRYSGTGVGAVLLWGVEDWLTSPAWMRTGQAAFQTLRK